MSKYKYNLEQMDCLTVDSNSHRLKHINVEKKTKETLHDHATKLHYTVDLRFRFRCRSDKEEKN